MNKKKVLSLILILVLVCSMVVGLTACGDEPTPSDDTATIYFKNGFNVTSQVIHLNDFKGAKTLEDVLKATDNNYGFDADINDGFINDIAGKGLVPNAGQFVSPYSTTMVENPEDYQKVAVKVDGVDFYPNMGVGTMKLEKDAKYLFNMVNFEVSTSNLYFVQADNTFIKDTIYLCDYKNGASVADVLDYDLDKYGFKVEGEVGQYGLFIESINGRGLVPNAEAKEYVAFYTTKIVEDDPTTKWDESNIASKVTVDGVDFYSAPLGVSSIKLAKDAKFMFKIEVNTYPA